MLADATTIVTRWTLKVYQAHKPVCISHLSSKAICVHLSCLTKHLFVKESLVCTRPVAYPYMGIGSLSSTQAISHLQAKLCLHLSYLTKETCAIFCQRVCFHEICHIPRWAAEVLKAKKASSASQIPPLTNLNYFKECLFDIKLRHKCIAALSPNAPLCQNSCQVIESDMVHIIWISIRILAVVTQISADTG